MPTIAAANNLTIRSEGNNWTLLNGSGDTPTTIVQASPAGLIYGADFGTARRLPAGGSLPADQITMVVVGWAVEDSSWHLGVMVTPELAQTRGGRWCGLARWSGEDGDNAADAGDQLAAALGKPFRVVPPTSAPTVQAQPAAQPAMQPSPQPQTQPQIQSQPQMQPQIQPQVQSQPQTLHQSDMQPLLYENQATRPIDLPPMPTTLPEIPHIPPPPLQPLPISVGEWSLHEAVNGLIWKRSQGWRNKTLLNALFFAVLTIIFGALSIGARLSIFAPVQPEWLPLVGIALTALLALLMIGQLLSLVRATSILIDDQQGLIRVLRGYNEKSKRKSGSTVIQTPYEGVEYVLISQIISRQEAGTSNNPMIPAYNRIWPEVWIHLYSPRRGFIGVCYISQTEGRMRADIPPNVRRALDLSEIDTPAHHAAQHMADMIGIPAYVETR